MFRSWNENIFGTRWPSRGMPTSIVRMSRRFTQWHTWEKVHAYRNTAYPSANLRTRYDIAPGQMYPPIRAHPNVRLSTLPSDLTLSRGKEPDIGDQRIRARAATVCLPPAYRLGRTAKVSETTSA